MTIRKILAAMLAGTVCVLSAGMMAFGAGDSSQTGVTSIQLTKILNKDKELVAPNTTFSFAVKADSSAAGKKDTADNTVKNGVEGGVTLEADSVSFTPALSDNGQTQLTSETRLVMHPDLFKTVGIYRYVLTENKGTYEGVAYDERTIYLDLYVESSDSSDPKAGMIVRDVVAFIEVTGSDGTVTKQKVGGSKIEGGGVSFTNKMTDTDSLDSQRVCSLTVTNTVDGNQGDLSQKFTYSLVVNGSDDDSSGSGRKEQYLFKDAQGNYDVITSGESITTTLSDGEKMYVYGLSQSDTFRIVQTAEDGYTTQISRGGLIGSNGDTGTQSMVQSGSFINTIVKYRNTKEIATPTGIAFTYGPYLLMIVFSGVLIVLFAGRKHREER